MRRQRQRGSAVRVAIASAVVLSAGCVAPEGAGANRGATGAPEVILTGPQTVTPPHRYPTSYAFADPYVRAWDAVAAVVASRGFPVVLAARASGILTTDWRVTQPHHRTRIGGREFIGRKVERLTVLVRPVAGGGTQVAVSSQTALVSPQWSVAGVAPPGQAVDIPSDTVTEYGIVYDVARMLGHRLPRAPDSAYGVGLDSGGVFSTSGTAVGGPSAGSGGQP